MLQESVVTLNRATSSLLPDAFERQDEQFAPAFALLQKAIVDRAFPAASVAVTHRGRLVVLKAVGDFTYNGGAAIITSSKRSEDIDSSTLFDLASLTKVVATTPMAMLLYNRGLLDLDAPLAAIVPEFLTDAAEDSRRHEVTLRMLMAHSSGLPAYEKLFLKTKTRDQLLRAAFTMPLAADPATRALYSDIGFIILGIALERLADESLDRFCQREIFSRLAMTTTTFNPPAGMRARIPPTADERVKQDEGDVLAREMPQEKRISPGSPAPVRSTFRRKIIQGEVQDENANVLGGVAAHAGLFSTARDLAQFADAMLECGPAASAREVKGKNNRIFTPETVALFTQREAAPPGTSRALGWDTPSSPSQSGKYFSTNSFGHLGYTGTSLWIDPVRQLSITLLTNRTWPDCSNQAIKTVRPRFHDALIEALD